MFAIVFENKECAIQIAYGCILCHSLSVYFFTLIIGMHYQQLVFHILNRLRKIYQ